MRADPHRVVRFSSDAEKAAYLDAKASEDATSAYVREVAGRFAASAGPNPRDKETLVRSLHRFTRDGIRYVHDGTLEELADAKTILSRGWDDCDGKARVFCALCRAVKVQCRILPRTDGARFAHVQAWVTYPGAVRHPKNVRGWLKAEFIVRDLELGDDAPPNPVLT